MASASESVINERAQHFLKVLIERYIQDGTPVGSRTLARDSGMNLSPATIRNVMSDLEEMGLITSPHTSSGRIPTVSGYRFFLDFLVTLKQPGQTLLTQVQEQLKGQMGQMGQKQIAETASNALSELTHMAGLVMIPKRESLFFRQIEFLPLSANRVLVILISSDGEVHNRVIETSQKFSQSELVESANFLNRHYAGEELEVMRDQLINELENTRSEMDAVMKKALSLAGEVLGGEQKEGDYVVSGQTNLMGYNDLTDVERLKLLFDSFAEKRQILHLLDRCMEADGVQIFIGEESHYDPLETCSLVTSAYEVDGAVAGVLGVIGPTRMAYDKVIPIVDVTAKLLSVALKSE
ncbi:heat-inducible transcriptional repressor HrcA [Solemya velum gill symbiont]|uniref:heat-inducible transcriptional repressor HrcA n=1 Tax=Solemya velum gill symbiont TaxID=2340 RepID=UPI000998E3CD|nr:heat-inducible transcriptional repressor HrcA [Solemya velum gill symbiont]OOZ44265.1 heat-inducible transcriptional repressor HrcA [Solemya velum gill symbiont]OOZ48030.1 heat-inducible transcriptional repressor HrcA [Solemya velum gill symbiont]OOZ52972.1 heat-inducible transcriptional repressor HrcA [Solemya velum gill symbiont]OOZ56240.1 heat-inducible transcriptional repressor HrcA [Solemya velum gill symbiont]OOZ59287.1 heat-inducible transcriptional repressor HrcA [Solemya velum gill